MKKTLFPIVLILAIASTIHAQEVNVNTNLELIFPQGEFKQSMDRLGVGIQLNGYYRFPNTIFGMGLDFGFKNFGVDSREEPLSSTIPDLKVEVNNSYNLLQFMLLAKAQPADGAVRPYIEALAGYNYFFTETEIRNRGFGSDEEPIATDTNFEDWAFAWGGGTGVMIKVYDQRGREAKFAEDGSEVYQTAGYVNIGVRYLYGQEAEYLKQGSIQIDNGNVTYATSRSKTDMMIWQLGFVLRF
jgi:opacity protein-like surface antigen